MACEIGRTDVGAFKQEVRANYLCGQTEGKVKRQTERMGRRARIEASLPVSVLGTLRGIRYEASGCFLLQDERCNEKRGVVISRLL